jgi:hypothetical protein
MGDERALGGRGGEAGCDRGKPQRNRKRNGPSPQYDRADDGGSEQGEHRPKSRFALGRKIQNDAAAERYSKPGSQPARSGLDQSPGSYLVTGLGEQDT